MNLHETVKALEAKNITIGLDIGVHQYCALDSNCPIAVQLRKLIGDAGITLEELLEGYQEVTAPDPVDSTLPLVASTLHIKVMGKDIQLDMGDVITGRLETTIRNKLRELDSCREALASMGQRLYHSYLAEIRRRRNEATLAQLSFPISDMIATRCLITCGDRKYIFLFPARYHPRYIIRDHIRYQLSGSHVRTLEQDIFIKFTINQNGNFLRADTVTLEGRKFQHYHGDHQYDCWGAVVLPQRWNKTLSSLARLNYNLTMSLGTINRDSILERQPPNMPHVDILMDESTELGREGVLDEHPEPAIGRGHGWGRTTRGGRPETPQPPITPEFLRGAGRR